MAREEREMQSVIRGAGRSATRARQGQAGADDQGEGHPPSLEFDFVTHPLPSAWKPQKSGRE